ncbi:hypothetical protein, partial [uncultured Chitinophaga sp.]|uniref:hypothetical protein n=1 Tax=uncultured Chitinophaga sp. TaxID=339340 RepID=UPI0025DF5533
MKKVALSMLGCIVAVALYFIATAYRLPDEERFYYAFDEKIPITPIPGKYVVRFKDAASAKLLATNLRTAATGFKEESPEVVTINIKAGESPEELLRSQQANIATIKPAYRAGEQELYYTTEVLVELKAGRNINDVIKAAGVDPATIKINAGKFFYLLEIALSLDALDVANR